MGMNFLRLFRTIPFFRKELGLIIEYGEVKIQVGKRIGNICGKNLGILLYPSQSDHEPCSTTGLYFCSPANRFIVCSYVAADVSKYGGKFLDEKNDDEIKKSYGKRVHSGRNVGGVAYH